MYEINADTKHLGRTKVPSLDSLKLITYLLLSTFPITGSRARLQKSEVTDTNNYRGIALISCLAKLFTRGFNDSLNKWAIFNVLLYSLKPVLGIYSCT